MSTLYASSDIRSVSPLGRCKGHVAKKGERLEVDCDVHEPYLRTATDAWSADELEIPLTRSEKVAQAQAKEESEIALGQFASGLMADFRASLQGKK